MENQNKKSIEKNTITIELTQNHLLFLDQLCDSHCKLNGLKVNNDVYLFQEYIKRQFNKK